MMYSWLFCKESSQVTYLENIQNQARKVNIQLFYTQIIPRQKPQLPAGAVALFKDFLKKDTLHGGAYITQFESEFAAYHRVKHAILISSGRLALYMVLKHYTIGKGDEVILPSYTCPVVPSVILDAGAQPVFVDILPETLNMDPFLVEEQVTKNTKAIIATHIGGHPCNLKRITAIAQRHNIKIIEDCAQAVGAEYNGRRVGSIGDAAYFSFATGKQINTMGGGALTTNDDVLARNVRNYIGSLPLPEKKSVGKNFMRMYVIQECTKPVFFNTCIFPLICISNLCNKDIINVLFEDNGVLMPFARAGYTQYSNLQAAIGLQHFRCLEDKNQHRIDNAQILNTCLNPAIPRQRSSNDAKAIYLYYTLILENRLQVKKRLLASGIDTQENWNIACSSSALFSANARSCPVAEEITRKALYIPNFPGLIEKDMRHIAEAINRAVGARDWHANTFCECN